MRVFLLSLFIVVTLMFATNQTTRAACPTGAGWYADSTEYIINSGFASCTLKVMYCVRIGPGNVNQVIIDEVKIPGNCGISFTMDLTFWQNIENAVFNDLASKITIPPCGTGSFIYITIERSSCWKFVKTSDFIESFQKCLDTGLCKVENKVCISSTSPLTYNVEKTYYLVEGETPCFYGVFNYNPLIIPPFESQCYYICE